MFNKMMDYTNQFLRVDVPSQQDMQSEALRSPQPVKEVALKTLKELGVVLALAATVFPFISPATIPLILAAGIGAVTLNAGARSVQVYYAYHRLQPSATKANLQDYTTIIHYLNYIPPLLFCNYYLATASIFVHEVGHAAAASLLYQSSHPTITIKPFIGGSMHRSGSALTGLGQVLGETNSRIAVSAAGTGFTLISALVAIGSAHYMSKTHPEVARYLLVMAMIDILNSCAYALSTFFITMSGHDFKFLWTVAGIHPLVAVIFIVALPIGFKLLLKALDSLRAV